MSSVSEQLRQARLAQNLSIERLAEITKIRGDHLRALEEGNYDVFPAPVYIRGFVRTYAKVLKLDGSQIVAELESELSQTKKFREPPPLIEKPRGALDFLMLQLSRLNWRVATGVASGSAASAWNSRAFRARITSGDPIDTGPGNPLTTRSRTS